jgi:type IV pilus assembly protein PilC
VYIIVGIVLVGVGYKSLRKVPLFCFYTDKVKLKLPLIGSLVQRISVARFSRTLGTLIGSGVPILQALNITKDTAGNEVMRLAITNVHASIREGETIADPLERSGVFPLMLVNMINVGEETGQLDSMLLKIADTYDGEVDVAVEALASMLEPLMIVFLGLAVGFIVIAMFMPLFKLALNIGN